MLSLELKNDRWICFRDKKTGAILARIAWADSGSKRVVIDAPESTDVFQAPKEEKREDHESR